MRLSVIGCGHLGAVHAARMADIGHEVLGVDIDESKTEMLNSGKAWFREPGLDEMLARNISAGRLRFTPSFADAAEFATVHFLSEVISAISFDVAVLEMGEDECGAGNVADLAGAGGDVLESAPALGEQGEPAFAEAAQGALEGIEVISPRNITVSSFRE